jgi:hypothetical protein
MASLKNLRPAPGQKEAKNIIVGNEKQYLNDSWSFFTFDPSSTSILLCPLTTLCVRALVSATDV